MSLAGCVPLQISVHAVNGSVRVCNGAAEEAEAKFLVSGGGGGYGRLCHRVVVRTRKMIRGALYL
jgi:hypothetical protein